MWYNMQHQVLEIHGIITLGASEHRRQRSLEITRDMKLYGSHSRLTNVLESGDNRVLDQIMKEPIPCVHLNVAIF